MPKIAINYSNTIIYMLCCLDVMINAIYVGHTTNFTQRKNKHKSNCTNQTTKKSNLYVYRYIRDHGGWDNWTMVVLENVSCNNKLEAMQHERRWIETKQASLNKTIPTRTMKEYCVENADKISTKRKDYYINNVDKILAKKKEYDSKNIYKRKKYLIDNKEAIAQQRKLYGIKVKMIELYNKLNHRHLCGICG